LTAFTNLGAVTTIILISLSLSADNALVIGMAVHGVADRHRKWTLAVSIGGAIVFRVVFAGLFAILLFKSTLPGVRLVGGLVLLWVAFNLLDGSVTEPTDPAVGSVQLRSAIGMVLLADASMSLDNMLAVASASGGDLRAIAIGLLVSIPLLFMSASTIARALDRFPRLLWLGAGIIAWVAGQLISAEPLLQIVIPFEHHGIFIGGFLIVLVIGCAVIRER
jgi:YjbE family integral membrane protein